MKRLFQLLPLGDVRRLGVGLVLALLAVVAEVLQPLLQRGDFTGLVGQLGLLEGVEKFPDGGDAVFHLAGGRGKFLLLQRDHAPGPREHQQELRAELLQRPGQFVGLGKLVHEVEHLQVPLRVAHDRIVVTKLVEADVAVVILDGLLLEPRAVFAAQDELLVAAVVFGTVLFQLADEMVEKGFVAKRAFAVRPALRVHLKHAQVEAELDFLDSVLRFEPSDEHLAGLVFPRVQQARDVVLHRGEYGGDTARRQLRGETYSRLLRGRRIHGETQFAQALDLVGQRAAADGKGFGRLRAVVVVTLQGLKNRIALDLLKTLRIGRNRRG